MIIEELIKENKITPPKWLPNNLHYLVKMGSHAYDTNTDSSDLDFYGWCIPPKEYLFPHLAGYIEGFGTKPPSFNSYNEMVDTYDFTIFSIVKYFDLCMNNNPNMLDSLFVPLDCIVFQTQLGVMVRENKSLFVSKRCWKTFMQYAYSQLKMLRNAKEDSKRAKSIVLNGYDVKAACHLFRLMFECIQLLEEGTMDLRKHSKFLLEIRSGTFEYNQIIEQFQHFEVLAEDAYKRTELPERAEEGKLLELLHTIINIHYAGVSSFKREEKLITDIVSLLQQGGYC